jgi:hypothetical protein
VPLLWSDLVAAHEGKRFASAQLPLPARPRSEPPDGVTTVYLTDDGKGTRTVVRGGRHLRAPEVTALLTLEVGAARHVMAASSVKVDGAGRDVTLEFPSLAAASVPKADSYCVSLGVGDSGMKHYAAVYAPLPAKDVAPLVVDANATSVKLSSGEAAIGLRLSRDKVAHASIGEGTPLGLEIMFAKVKTMDPVANDRTHALTGSVITFSNEWLDTKPALVLTLKDVIPAKVVLRPVAGGKPAGSDVVITIQP